MESIHLVKSEWAWNPVMSNVSMENMEPGKIQENVAPGIVQANVEPGRGQNDPIEFDLFLI